MGSICPGPNKLAGNQIQSPARLDKRILLKVSMKDVQDQRMSRFFPGSASRILKSRFRFGLLFDSEFPKSNENPEVSEICFDFDAKN